MTHESTIATQSLTRFASFRHFETHHCVTGSMRHIYAFNGYDISEDLLLGLGEGVGFMYWHQKGQLPFIGGRGTPKPSMESIAGERTGVLITQQCTRSAAKAQASLIAQLEQGQPVMLQVDMGFLPYFDFGGEEYHFGGHAVVACGYDAGAQQVLIADRDQEIHPVSLVDLARARGSTHKPFPPQNTWVAFDFTNKRQPTTLEIATAIHNQAAVMLNPPITNMGVAGMRKTADMVVRWPRTLGTDAVQGALFSAYIFISPVGGSGGGAFRYMLSRFLKESAERTGSEGLAQGSVAFGVVADRWAEIGEAFRTASEHTDSESVLAAELHAIAEKLRAVAALEAAAWTEVDLAVKPMLAEGVEQAV